MNKIQLSKFFCLEILFFTLTFASCSLKYSEDESQENSTTPEFIFTNANYYRYKKDKKDLEFHADVIEQYKNHISYAKNIKFVTWDTDLTEETRGSCLLLSMDTSKEVYTLVSDIFIENLKDNMTIRAQNLKWNGKSEQLTSGKEDIVFLSKDEIQIQGTGFSASGVSQKFNFTGNISGKLITDDNETEDTLSLENTDEE